MPGSRTPLVAGNWKMNPTDRESALALARGVRDATRTLAARVVVCPPAIWLTAVSEAVEGAIGVGAQTMHADDAGAFTGEISPVMLSGWAEYVILGHSERRRYDNETDEAVAAKVASAVEHGLMPIAAIGERREERQAGETEAVVERQLRAAISRLDHIGGSGLVVAYEPVWAIGTGDAATPADAQAAAAQIRGILADADAEGAAEVPILYGGSCTPKNAAELFAMPDVDGALVGGASLDPVGFATIVRAAAEAGR